MSERLRPTVFERLEQGSKARGVMIEKNRCDLEENPLLPESIASGLHPEAKSRRFAAISMVVAPAAALALLAACGTGQERVSPSVHVSNPNILAIYNLDSSDQKITEADVELVETLKVDVTGDSQVTEGDEEVVRKYIGVKNIKDTTSPRTPEDTFIPGELIISFEPRPLTEEEVSKLSQKYPQLTREQIITTFTVNPRLTKEEIADIYEEHYLRKLGDTGRPNQHWARFTSQDINELESELSEVDGIQMVEKNYLYKPQK